MIAAATAGCCHCRFGWFFISVLMHLLLLLLLDYIVVPHWAVFLLYMHIYYVLLIFFFNWEKIRFQNVLTFLSLSKVNCFNRGFDFTVNISYSLILSAIPLIPFLTISSLNVSINSLICSIKNK